MSSTDRLEAFLQDEIEAYSRLLQIEREKEQAIAGNDAEALLEVLSREEPAVARANELERCILDARNGLARELCAGGGVLTLREIIAVLEPPVSTRLEGLRVKLFGFAEEIRRINQTNYLLLKQSIELLDEVVSALLGEAPAVNTYENDGRVKTGSGGGALSIRA